MVAEAEVVVEDEVVVVVVVVVVVQTEVVEAVVVIQPGEVGELEATGELEVDVEPDMAMILGIYRQY